MDFTQRMGAEEMAKELKVLAKYSDCWCNNRSENNVTRLMNDVANSVFEMSMYVSALEIKVDDLENRLAKTAAE